MKVYYQLSKTKKRIQLESQDIHALLFLNEQGILSQPQFYEFYCILNPMDEAAFRRKMNRWNEANIINKRKEKMVNGYKLAIIELTGSGQSILKKLGFLSNEDNLKYKPKSNLDHTLAIKQTVIEFLKVASKKHNFYIAEGGKYLIPLKKDAFEYGIEEPILIYKKQNLGTDAIPEFDPFAGYNQEMLEDHKKSGVLQSFVPQYLNSTDMNSLTPDWTFKVKDTFIYIEVDSGSEKIKTSRDQSGAIINKKDIKSIEGKLYRYEELAGKDVDHKHIIVFTLIDDSNAVITTGNYSKKDTRIANLKHEIGFMNNFSKWPMDIYIVGMKRFVASVNFLFNKILEENKNNQPIYLEYFDVLKKMAKLNFIPSGWKAKGFLYKDFDKIGLPTKLNYYPDIVFCFVKEQTKHDQYIIPLFVREGNVKDMEILAYYTEAVKQGKFKTDARILAIYETKEELVNDVIRKTKKVYSNSNIKDNNGMDTKNIILIALDELTEKKLKLYNANKERIEAGQMF